MSFAKQKLHIRPYVIVLITFLIFFLLWLCPDSSSESGWSIFSSPAHHGGNAIVTFLNNQPDTDGIDYYYTTIRILAYQILHADDTKCRKRTPFIVIVTPDVTEEKRRQLTADGAVVIEPEEVVLPSWIRSDEEIWLKHFTKLRALELTEFNRILVMDATHVLMRPLDDVFSDPAVAAAQNTTITKLQGHDNLEIPPAQFVFAARTNNEFNLMREHIVPPTSGESLSVSFWVAAPCLQLHDYLVSELQQPMQFNAQNAEHQLFNHAFRHDGPMPWKELNYTWATNWSNEKDYNASIAAIHDRFWLGISPKVLQDMWWKRKAEMEAYFDGENTEK